MTSRDEEGSTTSQCPHHIPAQNHPMLRSSEASSTAGDHVGAAGAQTVVRGEESTALPARRGGLEAPLKRDEGALRPHNVLTTICKKAHPMLRSSEASSTAAD